MPTVAPRGLTVKSMPTSASIVVRRTLIALVALGLLVFIVRNKLADAPELPVINAVPAFEFTDQAGAVYGSTELEGKVWLASLLYTTCPGPCPRLVGQLGRLMNSWKKHDQLRFVSFTVDPSRDSPGVLSDYATAHDIDTGRWALLTADESGLFPFIRQAFLVEAATEITDLDDDEVDLLGPIAHSLHVFLVDGDSRLRGIYDTTDETAMRRLKGDVPLLLRNH